jgi:hypothetical protein
MTACATSTTGRSGHRTAWCPKTFAVTILINSRVAGTAFKAVQDHGGEVSLDALPGCALKDSDDGQRQAVCDVICTVIAWPGFAASVATKVLHKKRPDLIPRHCCVG